MARFSLTLRFVLLISLLGMPAAVAQDDEARTVATRTINNLMAAWNNRNGVAYAAEFWPDADFVNVFGSVMKDQSEIAARTDEILKGALSGRQSKITIQKIRRLAPNVIVVDSENRDAGTATEAVTRFKLILEKRGEVWHGIAAHNTRVTKPTF